ncbi:MAG: FAD-binding oxidoreductase [Candidatus Spechtbacterales bacterium]|nr:FAD-binding oxidoreductase [Candidatus Spechtbacterales bacterium]
MNKVVTSKMNFEDLKKRIRGDVHVNDDVVEEYSTDASLFKVRPEVVVFPKDAEDIKTAVNYAKENGASVTARAAGTDMSGGPLSESIVLGFTKYMNHMEVDPDNNSAITQPGVYYRDFEEETLKHELIMPSYPASRSIAAMGGIVNNNSGGEKTLRHGKTEDYVKEVKMVLADGNEYAFHKLNKEELEAKKKQEDFEGEVYRKMHELLENNYDKIKIAKPDVTKNSAGYKLWDVWDKEKGVFDMAQIFVGAQGTLGIMTEAKMKLIDPEDFTKLAVIFLNDVDEIPQLVNAITPLEPEALEMFDDETLKLALKFFPGIAKKVPGENLISLLWKFLPEGVMVLKNGLRLPKIVVLAQFAEEKEEDAEYKLNKLAEIEAPFNSNMRLVHTEQEAEKYWVIRRQSFALLRSHVKDKRTAPFIDDIVVKPEHLPEVMPKVHKILEEYGIKETIAGHAGDGNFHIIPLMDLSKEEEKAKIPEVSDKIYDLVLKYKGSITAEHNDGLIRSPYLKQMYGEDIYKLFEDTKNIFDPNNIFNPGKKVNSDLDYAIEHIDHQ